MALRETYAPAAATEAEGAPPARKAERGWGQEPSLGSSQPAQPGTGAATTGATSDRKSVV